MPLTEDDVTELAVAALTDPLARWRDQRYHHCICDRIVHREDAKAHAQSCTELRVFAAPSLSE